jgi:hypothetical protein
VIEDALFKYCVLVDDACLSGPGHHTPPGLDPRFRFHQGAGVIERPTMNDIVLAGAME